jgi:hypothetical protein
MEILLAYGRKITRTEFRCEGCQKLLRIDNDDRDASTPARGFGLRHCAKARIRWVGGPIVGMWQKRKSKWILTWQPPECEDQ